MVGRGEKLSFLRWLVEIGDKPHQSISPGSDGGPPTFGSFGISIKKRPLVNRSMFNPEGVNRCRA
jgi:hypothetical protein